MPQSTTLIKTLLVVSRIQFCPQTAHHLTRIVYVHEMKKRRLKIVPR